MTAVADRYVRTAEQYGENDAPQIYSGDLKGISAALRDIERLSKKHPGKHILRAIYDRTPCVLREYEGGECTGQWEQPT
jgi:hypothetical protein